MTSFELRPTLDALQTGKWRPEMKTIAKLFLNKNLTDVISNEPAVVSLNRLRHEFLQIFSPCLKRYRSVKKWNIKERNNNIVVWTCIVQCVVHMNYERFRFKPTEVDSRSSRSPRSAHRSNSTQFGTEVSHSSERGPLERTANGKDGVELSRGSMHNSCEWR